ncbi:MAG: YdgA family protein [Candidatus Competibacteraceae bacterium]|nr:YdgA family protein [Candidatus Competibacteraceae bacterium]
MRKVVGGIIVVLGLAAAYTGLSAWLGQQAEQQYKEALIEGSKNPNAKLSTIRYDRGLFSSQAVTRVQLDIPEASAAGLPDMSFAIRQDIYHGPLPLAGWGVSGVPMGLTGSVVRLTLDPESSTWTRELATLYGGQQPVEAISQIGFDGASNTRISMPPLTLNKVAELENLKFAGLQGQFQLAPRGATVQGELRVPSLEVVGQSAAAAGQPAGGEVQASLRDIVVTTHQRKGSFDLMFGDASFKIGELRVNEPSTKTPVVFTDLVMDTNATLHPQNPRQVNVDALFKAGNFTVEPWSGAGSLRLAFHNLDGATVAKLQQWQERAAANPDDVQALDELVKLMKSLLAGKPELVLYTQSKLAQGDWQGKLVLSFQDFGQVDLLQNPEGLLKALEKGSAEMAVSKTLAETVLTNMVKEEIQGFAGDKDAQADPNAMRDMARQQVAEQLQGVVAAGFMRLEGDQYKSKAHFENGKLFVNDKEIPLGALMGGGSGAMDGQMPLEPDSGLEPDAAPEIPQR